MYSLRIVSVLTLVVLANANPRLGLKEETDHEVLFREFIECARLAIISGIPEIGLPSHDPLVISHDLSYEYAVTGFNISISMDNMVITDIPVWEVRQFDELSSNDGIDIFNYTIYWPKMVFTGDWKFDLNFLDIVALAREGSLSFELDHINFVGIFGFTEPGDGRTETINELELQISTQEVQIDFTNFEELYDLIPAMEEELASTINSLDYTDLSEGLKNKLINDWIQKQERLDAIIAQCQS